MSRANTSTIWVPVVLHLRMKVVNRHVGTVKVPEVCPAVRHDWGGGGGGDDANAARAHNPFLRAQVFTCGEGLEAQAPCHTQYQLRAPASL